MMAGCDFSAASIPDKAMPPSPAAPSCNRRRRLMVWRLVSRSFMASFAGDGFAEVENHVADIGHGGEADAIECGIDRRRADG